jgi:hypothetical protein
MSSFVIVLLNASRLVAILRWLGRRRRRINNHQLCTRSDFDLVSVYPGLSTCLE